ncbi:elongation factor G-binding protein [Brevibacillus laterosporus]|uniref:FusB/FusC family EF-G-binding protein n=1 Tax=Brevibacillus laterosporus TaxID=1465 RepID=UPI002405D51A|nr:FusB/FusC family EF-G-binding protein [Brevibacillus laterosporus]MDF9413495.1 elongation factor G-binding protein [Brevibacillus laterosporus]
MVEPFIQNHQYNFIKKQIDILRNATLTVADPKVMEAVRYGAEVKVIDVFPTATDIQKQLLGRISSIKAEDFQEHLRSLTPYLLEFPQVTEKQIRKLFPKNKKLKVPDLVTIDFLKVTYLGWINISSNKLFIVYHLKGKAVGIEGRYSLVHKKNICALCHGYTDVALFSAISKSRAAHVSSDYYKAVGQYICINSHECNSRITDVTALERFIEDVMG